jgi:hypothetical protein
LVKKSGNSSSVETSYFKFQRNPFVIRKANINFQLDIASFEQFAHKNGGEKICVGLHRLIF